MWAWNGGEIRDDEIFAFVLGFWAERGLGRNGDGWLVVDKKRRGGRVRW